DKRGQKGDLDVPFCILSITTRLCILRVVLQYLDLASLRVGIPTEQGFMPLTVSFLARKTGITTSRTERVLRDLVNSGIMKSIRVCHLDTETGDYRGYAIRTVSEKFFESIGLTLEMIKKARKRASERLKKLARKAKIKLVNLAKVSLVVGG
ncbi:MAG: hypothetical protein M3H12_07255, partial [Chromatiales bacterium]